MDDLQKFIDSARARGWDDARIRSALINRGWDETEVDEALDDLLVPAPPAGHGRARGSSHASGDHHKADGRPSISALQAALQHVLLWLFTITSAVMIGIVSFTLFGNSGTGTSNSLLTYVVLELVTFVPFAYIYWQYLRQLGKQPDLMTGKVWSIITVVLHSVGLIGSLVAFLLVIVLVGGGQKTAGLVSSGMIALINALVVVAYVWANFAKAPQSAVRMWYLRLFPTALFVLVSVLGVIALMRVGPIRADDQTRQNLVSTVEKVQSYATQNKALPASQSDLTDVPDGVTYERLTATKYQVCASLNRATSDKYVYSGGDQTDDYPYSGMFYGKNAGKNCWTLTSGVLTASPKPLP